MESVVLSEMLLLPTLLEQVIKEIPNLYLTLQILGCFQKKDLKGAWVAQRGKHLPSVCIFFFLSFKASVFSLTITFQIQ